VLAGCASKKKIKKPLDKRPKVCYIINIMNEQEEQTRQLLDLVCQGVEVPTDAEAEEAKRIQQGDDLIL